MSISSVPNRSALSELFAPASAPAGNLAAASIGDQLLAAIAAAQTANAGASESLLQEIVSLNSAGSAPSSAPAPLTYDASGLLAQVLGSVSQGDPLLQPADASSSSVGFSDALLTSLLPSAQSSSEMGAETEGGATAINAAWMQILAQAPSLATALSQSMADQSVLSLFG